MLPSLFRGCRSALLLLSLACGLAAAIEPVIPDVQSSAPVAGRALSDAALGDALRKGGYVIYFRHTQTDFSKTDAGMQNYGDCANQRLLSVQGKETARRIGNAIRKLRLPVQEVLSSPYCRTMDTARLIFGEEKVKSRNEIREEQGANYPGLKILLATPVASGSLRWIIGHGTPFRSIAGPPHLAEGEAAVLEPTGSGWAVVARIQPDQWNLLR
ncbi:histidine phosphatase family protein [Noviherbaspirillum galbum]|uniref:Histidine phosphatase family protein n=1 Tax=Noviherbaspirillum galbum TaxID=2709383 RepID=A0A6B3STI5_9BURK|nr:histidine phosphatase family protein [Noviherbaspirillum galbum]NEX63974.1 hypothetical protein [Noviherbaspirillum galbum]